MELTFTTRGRDGRTNFWTPERPGDYGAACAMGRDYGAEMIAHIQKSGDPSVFGAVMRAISNCGIYDGVEAGFCSVIGIHLLGTQAPTQPRDTISGPVPDALRRAFPASR